MTRTSAQLLIAFLMACAGCAARSAAPQSRVAPAPVPASVDRGVPHPPQQPVAASGGPATGAGSSSAGAAQPTAVTAPVEAAAPRAVAPAAAAASAPPAATASTYVFSPQQAVSAGAASPQQGGAAPGTGVDHKGVEPAAASQPGTQDSPPSRTPPAAQPPRGALQLAVVASVPEVAAGKIVTVDVFASSATAVVDAPLHLSFDPALLAFVDGAPGDFLTQGGSSVVFLVDGASRPGDVAVAVGRIDRAQGASGAGLLCRIHLRGLAAGPAPIAVAQAQAWGTQGEPLDVILSGTSVVVR